MDSYGHWLRCAWLAGVAVKPMPPARRRRALQLMVDRCVITRAQLRRDDSGREVWERAPVYEGRCKISSYEAYEQSPDSGRHEYTVQRYRLDLPLEGTDQVRVGDLAYVEGYRYPLRIASLFKKTHQTARRLLVDMVTD